MEIDASLRIIRIQIRHGRAVEASKALEALWEKVKYTQNEKNVLEVFALEFLKSTRDCTRAIPVLHRLLELEIDDHVRAQAVDFLRVSEFQENLMPSDPDPHTPDFVEFMKTVRKRDLFKPARKYPVCKGHIHVRSLDVAQELAWHQGIGAPYQSWNMLRTEASKQLHTHFFRNKIKMDMLKEIDREISRICWESLLPTMMNFYDDIYADLSLIAMGKIVGVVPHLHTKMWNAYQKRHYPCGWQGNFPAGKLCLFPNRS